MQLNVLWLLKQIYVTVKSQLADAYTNQLAQFCWRQVYNANTIKAASSPANSVNGHTSPGDIANEFKHMYPGIFCVGFTTEADLNVLRRLLENSCNIFEWTALTIDKIISACHQL